SLLLDRCRRPCGVRAGQATLRPPLPPRFQIHLDCQAAPRISGPIYAPQTDSQSNKPCLGARDDLATRCTQFESGLSRRGHLATKAFDQIEAARDVVADLPSVLLLAVCRILRQTTVPSRHAEGESVQERTRHLDIDSVRLSRQAIETDGQ